MLHILIQIILALQDAPVATPPITLWELAYEPQAPKWITP